MVDNPLVQIHEQLNARLNEFKHALPPQIPPERFIRVSLTALQINPELAVVDRRSLFNALMRSASDGLLPDGRQAAIVPFNDNNPRSPTYKRQIAVYIPMVAGLLSRFRNSGQFKQVSCNVVRKGESFRHWIDETGEHLSHDPGDDDGAPIVKAYAMATTRDGGVAVRVMSREAIEKRRAVSRAKDGPMWRDWYPEACQKTVLKNLMKILPSSSDDIDRLARDDDDDAASFEALPPPEPRERLATSAALQAFAAEATDPPADPPADPQAEAATDKPADAPAPDAMPAAIELARELGRKQRAEGVQRRAVPPEYRNADRAAEAEAWCQGWDNALV